MGSISCCDKKILHYFRENQRDECRPENINLKRNGKPKQMTSVLAIDNPNSSNSENLKQNTEKDTRNKTIIEMDEKLKKIHHKQNDNLKDLDKLSGKKLLAEVFS